MGLADDMMADTAPVGNSTVSPNDFQSADSAADKAYGFPDGTMHAISSIESNNNPKAVNKNSNGTIDNGRFQINSSHPGLDGNNPMQAGSILNDYLQKAGGDINKAVAMYNVGPNGNINGNTAQNYVSKWQKAALGGPTPPVTQFTGNQPTGNQPISGMAALMAKDYASTGGLSSNMSSDSQNSGNNQGNSTTQNLLAGIGHGMVTSIGNAKQGLDMAANSVNSALSGTPIGNAINYLGNKLGLPSTQQSLQNTNQFLANNQKYGGSVTNTTAGSIGNVVGQSAILAPTALIPGANTLTGAAAIGAGAGLTTTEGNLQNRMAGAAGGAAGGAIGLGLGNLVGAGVSKLGSILTPTAEQAAASAPKNSMVNLAQQYGIKVNPQESNPGAINGVLSGISGKVATAQDASSMNQPIINNVVKKALGLSPEAPLTMDALSSIRQQAGAAYNTVRDSGTVTAGENYNNALNTIMARSNGQATSFPGLKNDDISNVLQTLNQKQFDAGDAVDATGFLRNLSDKAYSTGDKQAGIAYKQASSALEDALDEHLQNVGDPNALTNFRNARQTIAQTYSVQKAMNPATGDIDAGKLAAQLNKGVPLSGPLKDIAQINSTFPKSTQLLKTPYQTMSPLDYAIGLGTGIASGNPLATGAVLARPAIRTALLSSPYQKINNALGTHNYVGNLINNSIAPIANSQTLAQLARLAGTNEGQN